MATQIIFDANNSFGQIRHQINAIDTENENKPFEILRKVSVIFKTYAFLAE